MGKKLKKSTNQYFPFIGNFCFFTQSLGERKKSEKMKKEKSKRSQISIVGSGTMKDVPLRKKESGSNGELFIQVVKGEDLLPMDFGISSDPFVVLKMTVGGEKNVVKKWRTRVISKNLNPQWNEGTSFLVPSDKEEETKVCDLERE